MNAKIGRINRARTGLVLVDIQERLLPAIHENDRVLRNAIRLAQGAAILGIPSFVTEQYRKGLGPTVLAVAEAVPGFAPMEKLAFSACGAAGFVDALKTGNLADVILCGIEAHVCVCQTCLDLIRLEFGVFVVADAISSRAPENCRVALDRMRDAGAVIVSTEMVLFELLETAGTDEFRRVQSLIK
jgi:isochorismate hydrolase